MASWQWADTGGSTYIVKFNASSADATYQWRIPYSDNPQPRQVMVETLDGGVRVYDLSSAPQVFTLRFNTLPEGSSSSATDMYGYAGVRKFLETYMLFGKTKFTLSDHAGTDHTVRYLRGIESFTRGPGGYYSGEIVLREELV